jgi:hypothetical protein
VLKYLKVHKWRVELLVTMLKWEALFQLNVLIWASYFRIKQFLYIWQINYTVVFSFLKSVKWFKSYDNLIEVWKMTTYIL